MVRGTVWEGRQVEPGEVLDLSPRDAHMFVHGWADAVFIGDAPPPPAAMVINADPQIHHADPVVDQKPVSRRRRS